jgi:hypothetical protein
MRVHPLTRRCLVMAIVLTGDLGGQETERATRSGPRESLPVAEEIALARSAAPPSIAANARVLMLGDTGYVVAADGSPDVTCVVNRSWNRSVEPHCYDAEAAATVMRIELRRNWLRHAGRTEADIATDLANGLRRGDLRLPTRPALSYMMSAHQVLYDDAGRFVGRWHPHLMIYYPKLRSPDLGLPATPEMRVGMVAGEGTDESSLIIIMPAFVEIAGRL